MRRKRGMLVILGAVVALASVVIVILATGSVNRTQRARSVAKRAPVYFFHTDHETYSNLASVSNASDVIVIGEAISKSVEPGISPGVDGEGDPLPAIPHTNYTVRIKSTIKGSLLPGSTLIVSLAGGKTESEEVRPEDGYSIREGVGGVFFLQANANGKYYPLAGGAAIAEQQPDGSYKLPPDASQESLIAFSEAEVRNVASRGNGAELIASGSNEGSAGTAKGSVQGAKTNSLLVRVRLVSHQNLASALVHGLHLVASCSTSPCTLTGEAVASTGVAKSLKLAHVHHSVMVGSGRTHGSGTLILRFTKEARQHLRARARVTLTLVIVGSGPHGERVTTKGTLILTHKAATLKH